MQTIFTAAAFCAALALAACGQQPDNTAKPAPTGPNTGANAPTPAQESANNNAAAPATPLNGTLATGGGAAAQQATPAAKAAESAPMQAASPTRSNPEPPGPGSEANPVNAQMGPRARDRHLRETAELFETISDKAFSMQPRALTRKIGAAERQARDLKPILAQAAVGRLTRHLRDLSRAEQADSRADIAVAAADVFRVLTTSTSGRDPVPAAVEVMDYAGFRYRADLKAVPVRWNDAARAADIAKQQWAGLRGRVHDRKLAHAMAHAVQGMEHAAARERAKKAEAAVRREQNAVDELETYFRKA